MAYTRIRIYFWFDAFSCDSVKLKKPESTSGLRQSARPRPGRLSLTRPLSVAVHWMNDCCEQIPEDIHSASVQNCENSPFSAVSALRRLQLFLLPKPAVFHHDFSQGKIFQNCPMTIWKPEQSKHDHYSIVSLPDSWLSHFTSAYSIDYSISSPIFLSQVSSRKRPCIGRLSSPHSRWALNQQYHNPYGEILIFAVKVSHFGLNYKFSWGKNVHGCMAGEVAKRVRKEALFS